MFSQYEEEKYILDALEYAGMDKRAIVDAVARHPELVESRRFLDVGAWNPTDKSNTRALYELGWGGIVIEPSPGPVQNLVREYGGKDSRVKVISAAVTVDERRLMEMEVTDDAVTQPVEGFNEQWREFGYYGRLLVPCLSMCDVFDMFGGDFEMISFDTEGSSVPLFAEMCRLGPRPRCVIVEHDSNFVELAGIAQAANYQQVHLNGTNVVLRWTGGRER